MAGRSRNAEVEEGLVAELKDPATDGALIRAASDDNAQAFAILYDRHLDRVYRHVYYRVGNRADVEDLTQQVFLHAWQAIGLFQSTGAPFTAWLFTIAHNLLMSSYRRTKDVQPLDLDAMSLARWANPEAEVFAHDDRRIVREAILRLKPEYQQVIILRFVENCEYPAIAAVLGKSEVNSWKCPR